MSITPENSSSGWPSFGEHLTLGQNELQAGLSPARSAVAPLPRDLPDERTADCTGAGQPLHAAATFIIHIGTYIGWLLSRTAL